MKNKARIAAIIFALSLLVGCSSAGVQQAYDLYDAHVDRSLVAGHDEMRGNYVEVRISPRRAAADGKSAKPPLPILTPKHSTPP